MEPLTITAHMGSAIVPGGPLFLDGILLFALGVEMGRAAPGGWEDARLVESQPLPLARVETKHGWWYAASQATPVGPEAVTYAHKRPMAELAEVYCSDRSLNQAAGPDKALRIPLYRRIGWLGLQWTCVGDLERVAELLAGVWGLGRRVGHGYGWVWRWSVARGGPSVEQYAEDLALRHLPCALEPPVSRGAVLRQIPLTPPYHQRERAVACWQVPEAS